MDQYFLYSDFYFVMPEMFISILYHSCIDTIQKAGGGQTRIVVTKVCFTDNGGFTILRGLFHVLFQAPLKGKSESMKQLTTTTCTKD